MLLIQYIRKPSNQGDWSLFRQLYDASLTGFDTPMQEFPTSMYSLYKIFCSGNKILMTRDGIKTAGTTMTVYYNSRVPAHFASRMYLETFLQTGRYFAHNHIITPHNFCNKKLRCRTLWRGSCPFYPNKKIKPRVGAVCISGGDTGTRTLDPMIKSHLLYQLSYVPKTELE